MKRPIQRRVGATLNGPNGTILRRTSKVRSALKHIDDLLAGKDSPQTKLIVSKSINSEELSKHLDAPSIGTLAGENYLNPIAPPYHPEIMDKAVKGNNTLLQALNALVVNCGNVGHTFEYIGKEEEKESPDVIAEKERLEGYVQSPDGCQTFRELKEGYWWDMLRFGYSFIEVGRDGEGKISWYRHIDAKCMRLCGYDPEEVPVSRPVMRGGKIDYINKKEKFRRYMRLNEKLQRPGTYYKEFGDERLVDPKKGSKGGVNLAESATEIIHTRLLPLSCYGNTEWENNFGSVLGAREAEIVNLSFFAGGGKPSIVVLVSGVLTDESITDIEDKFNSGGAKERVHRALVLEASGDQSLSTGIEGNIPSPKIDIKELGSNNKDTFFLEYDKHCAEKVRSSVRLPSIFLGQSENYNYATAQASIECTENQVFGPKRDKFDDMMNNKILAEQGLPSKYWKFTSKATKITDPAGVVSALTALTAAQAVSPNQAIAIYNAIFGGSLAEYEEEWGKVPAFITEMNAAQQAAETAAASQEKMTEFKVKNTSNASKFPGKRPVATVAKTPPVKKPVRQVVSK
ncbi:MAG: phage portal protein [Chitinophagaceae bacterium]